MNGERFSIPSKALYVKILKSLERLLQCSARIVETYYKVSQGTLYRIEEEKHNITTYTYVYIAPFAVARYTFFLDSRSKMINMENVFRSFLVEEKTIEISQNIYDSGNAKIYLNDVKGVGYFIEYIPKSIEILRSILEGEKTIFFADQCTHVSFSLSYKDISLPHPLLKGGKKTSRWSFSS